MKVIRDEDVLTGIGENLKKYRTRAALSQRKLALLAEIEVSQISRIERGLVNPSLITLFTIAKALEIPLSKLCTLKLKSR